MRIQHGRFAAVAVAIALAGCTATPDETAAPVEPSASSVPSTSPSEPAARFPTAAFADIRESPVSRETAAK